MQNGQYVLLRRYARSRANEQLANVSISRRSEAVYAKMDNVPMDSPGSP